MTNKLNLIIISTIALFLILGCGGKSSNPSSTAGVSKTDEQTAPQNVNAAPAEQPTAIQAKTLTKDYDDNELSADGKYKGKLLAVTGKVSNIAETMGKVTVSLEGHDFVNTVLCSFDDSEREKIAKLKKGQTATLVGRGGGKTLNLYVGLDNCIVK